VHGLGAKLSDAIHTGYVLEAVSQGADGMYTLSFKHGPGAFAVRARRVVLALPFTLLRNVHITVDLPAAKRRAIAELGYGTNAKLMIGFNERVWRTRHASAAAATATLRCRRRGNPAACRPARPAS
jgi:Monoamine oxidase